jgi:hypothetical protein
LFAHTIIISFSLYRRTVTGFGKISELQKYPEGVCATFGISGVLGAAVQVCIGFTELLEILTFVQSFYAYRLRKLSGSLIIPSICWALLLFHVGAITAISVGTCRIKTIQEYVDHWLWLVIVLLSVSSFVDILLTGSLSYYLWLQRRDVFRQSVVSIVIELYPSDAVNSSKKVVDRLIVWTIRECRVKSRY